MEIPPPSNGNYIDIVAGTIHYCAIDNTENIFCWGFDTDGQTNPGIDSCINVTAGAYHSCCLLSQPILGCTDSEASNYDPEATVDDGSCWYCDLGDVNCDGILNVLDIVIVANMVLANEYDATADVNEDGELNVLDIVTLANWVLNP